MASEATKMPVRGNMHMDTWVIKVPDLNLNLRPSSSLRARYGLRGHLNGCYGKIQK